MLAKAYLRLKQTFCLEIRVNKQPPEEAFKSA